MRIAFLAIQCVILAPNGNIPKLFRTTLFGFYQSDVSGVSLLFVVRHRVSVSHMHEHKLCLLLFLLKYPAYHTPLNISAQPIPLKPQRTETTSKARATVSPPHSQTPYISIMGNKPLPPASSVPRSRIINFKVSLPNDPYFQSRNRDPTSTAKADHEWRDEGWYFVPPEVDSDGKPVFAEAGDPCGSEAAKGEELTEGRLAKEEAYQERKG